MAFINMHDLRKVQDAVMSGDDVARAAAIAILTNAADHIASPNLRAQAKGQYGTDDIEIDDEPATSPTDTGTWVAAWVFIRQDDEEEEGDEE